MFGMTSVTADGRIEFRFFRPGASEVLIAGDFTGWQTDAVQMRPECDGWWSAELQLAPGSYLFRYIADGRDYLDFASDGYEPTPTSWASLLVVPESIATQ
jgi:1,4-alpha-glucan branching enzyme